MYLFWLRTGLSHERFAAIFQITRIDVTKYLTQVRSALSEEFVIQNIGVSHLTRENLQNHTTVTAKRLFLDDDNDDKIILIADVSYTFCNKSSNNDFQPRSYSEQKKAHLMKFFVICATDGYIVNIYGMEEAILNDAEILKSIIEKNEDNSNENLKILLKPNDIFILDRGFRDCLGFLKKDLKIHSKTPTSNNYIIMNLKRIKLFYLKFVRNPIIN